MISMHIFMFFFSFYFFKLCSIYWPSLSAFLLGERTMLTQWMQVCTLIVDMCSPNPIDVFLWEMTIWFSEVYTLLNWVDKLIRNVLLIVSLFFYWSLLGVTWVSAGKHVSFLLRLFLHFCQRGFLVQVSPLTTASPLCMGQRSALAVGF